jgi:hypothetical protein
MMQEFAGAGTTDGHEVTMGPPACWPVLGDARFRILLRHWAENRSGLMAPRSAIDPAAVRECLPHVWLYQYLPEENDFLCKLAGEKVNEAWGQSLIGKRVSQLMPPAMLARVPVLYRRMLQLPALQVSRRRITPPDRLVQSAERLILPLSRDDGTPYAVFGMTLYYLGDQSSFDDPLDMQGAVTLYDCSRLPATPP